MSLSVVQLGPKHAGVVALDIFKKGSVVYEFEGEVIEEPSRTSIEVYEDIHLEDDLKIASFINHKCKPNSKVKYLSGRGGWGDRFDVFHATTRVEKLGKKRGRKIRFIALKNIEIGEQITFDYNTTEYKIFQPFKCDCHGKLIKGNYYETRKRMSL
jgi:hypothetical protein